MPTYTFRNRETGEVVEHVLRMSEHGQFRQDNPHLEQIILQAPALGDPVALGVKKLDGGFKERLAQIKACNIRSDINV
jgi:hypothetical protein